MADFNTEPFFDDYSEDKQFYRVLFRPGYAVQARELTQLQTILQEQVARTGNHLFKEGAMVIPGQISYDLNVAYVKIANNASVNMATVLDELVGKEIKNSAGLTAKVITYTLAETVNNVYEEHTLFLKYQNSTQDLAGNNIQHFAVNDYLTPTDGSAGLNVQVADTTFPYGFGCTATIQRGIYYTNKTFVLVKDQTIVLDKYTNTPNYRVGLRLVEDTIYPEDDESILDNALGSPNYAAPGAARYMIDLVLDKIVENPDLVTVSEEKGFIDLLRLRNGKVIFKVDKTAYSEIEKTLARRTYDESGDYSLNPFTIQPREYRNNFRGSWAPNEVYIQGDLIKVSDGSLNGSNYFVATKTGKSASLANKPAFNNWASVDYFDDNTIRWEYVLYPDFNQGIYTFTAGDSDFANFTENDHIRLDGMLALGVEASKAYVRGYEIEKISTEYLPVPKSRYLPEGSAALATYFGVSSLPESTSSVSSQKTVNIDMSMGSYVIANKVKFAPDVSTFSTVNLHSVESASASTGTIIGTARVRALETHEGDTVTAGSFVVGETYTITTVGTTNYTLIGAASNTVGISFIATGVGAGTGTARSSTYKVFLFDVSMNTGKSFSSVKSIWNAANKFMCDMVQTSGSTTIINPDATSLIYQLPDYAIQSIIGAEYTVVVPFTQTAQSGALSIIAPTGYSFSSVNDANNYIVINNTANGGAIVKPTLALSNNVLTITGLSNVSYTVLATLKRAASSVQSLRTVTDASMAINAQATAQKSTITLNNSYVTRIVSVMMSANAWGTASPTYTTNITSRYSFTSGQDTSKIGNSSLTLLPGAQPPTGPILIKYEYLASTANTLGDFIGVGSYTHANSNMRYDQIPAVSGYALRDSIDFRPSALGAGYQTRYLPKFGTNASITYKNYLSRVDNISLSATGQYVVNIGIPSENPVEPNIPNLSMKLARADIEPFTFRRGDKNGIIITPVENKRYTMRDIGKLERRIQDLEYYTSLTLTELDTKNMRIIDSQGFERYQNGFLVDSFNGQGIGNVSSDDWNASIDSQNKELRPYFSQKQVDLLENRNSTLTGYKVSGDLVTLPFTEVDMISQNKASRDESVNPYAVYSWKGIVSINPWSDTWFSTHHRPDVILNDESQYNAIVAKAEADGVLGTVWNSWQVAFSSVKSLGTRMQNLGTWSTADTTILNASNNGGTFWRNRATFTVEELDFIGNTNHNILSAQANSVAGSRVITIETQATETTASRTGTRSYVVDKVDSRVLEDRVVDTQLVPYIRPRAVLFTGYGFKPSTKMYAFFDNVMVNDYIVPATRLKFTPVVKSGTTLYPFKFDVERNCGSNVSSKERTAWYSSGVDISGTISVTNGSGSVVGLATAFMQQVQIGDQLNLSDGKMYTVTAITDNYNLTITPVYSGTSDSGISASVIGPQHTTEEVEVAFNHGEVLKEYVNGVATGNSAIVVGQEVVASAGATNYYVYVVNVKGNGQFSTAVNSYLEGEYTVTGTQDKPRIKFLEKTVVTDLVSSESGLLCGVFNIPSSPLLKFRTGSRELVFSDSSYNQPSLRSTTEFTSGSATYEANGVVEIMQRTIVATRTANIVSEQVSDTNTIVTTTDRLTRDTGWFDPLAQTFLVQQEGGAFITSVDVYFSSADAKIPVRVEIREVVNGYPGSTVLPFSRVEKKASEVYTSSDSSVATTFKFSAPVFLQNGVEYALVVLSDSNNYRLWISQTLELDKLTNVAITSQPYAGVLFKSQNGSAWTPDQTQDMKFKIRCAEFSQTPVSIELIPPKLGYKSLGFDPLNLIQGSRKCRVQHPDHGMKAGDKVMLKSRQVVSSINGIPASNIFDVQLTIESAELDSYVVTFPGTINSNATGKVGGGYIAASENYDFQTAMLEVSEIVPPGTSISYTAKVINNAKEVKEYKMIPKENLSFEENKVYPSDINYSSTTFPSGLSIIATFNPSSTTKNVSPVLDLGRVAFTMVSNKIDSPDLSINDPVLDYITIGSAVQIGAGNALRLIDASGDGFVDTLTVDSSVNSTLFNNMNNSLNTGDVLRFTYSGITDAVRNMVITEKYQIDAVMYYRLLGYSGESVMETTTGQTVDIVWLSHFKSEYASVGGSTTSKYTTKKINFSRPSEMLKIMFAAMIPVDGDVEIYYKTGLGMSGDFIAASYSKATPSSYTKSNTDFVDIVADVENLAPFDSVIVKIVMKSINKAMVPRIKDFRVIACAA